MALLLCALLPGAAQAATQVIPGDNSPQNQRRLTIWIGDNGSLQAKNGPLTAEDPGLCLSEFPRLFQPFDCRSGSNYWHLRLKGAPAPDTTITSSETDKVNPVSNGPVTGDGTVSSPARNVTVYRVEDPNGETNLFEVRQTVLHVGFELGFRVVWEIRNIDPQGRTLRFIFGTSADLKQSFDGSGSPNSLLIEGPNRFLGASDAARRSSSGIQEVTASALPGEAAPTPIPRWASYQKGFSATARLEFADAFANTVDFDCGLEGCFDNSIGVSFDNRAGSAQGLAPGETQRYEVFWELERETPLTVSPPVAGKELPASHTVTFSLTDADLDPVPGVGVCVGVTGANPRPASRLVTDANGLVSLTYAGANPGLDTIAGRVDALGSGGCAQQSARDPVATATVSWLADNGNHVAGEPQVPTGLTGPNGRPIAVTKQPNPANPEAPSYQIARSASFAAGAESCVYDQRAGFALNLPVTVTLQPGAGAISGVQGYLIDPARHDPQAGVLPPALPPPTQSGNSYTFTVPCVVNGELWLEFTLTEGATSQVFRVPIGGLQLIDPQGVVYDEDLYERAVAAGQSPDQARAATALAGATVRLQRFAGGAFVDVLSGDPGISPNVNPQVTPASGIYQWDVRRGRYRVTVTRPGCQPVTSPAVDIPPPVLDLHIGMDCGNGTPPVAPPPVVPPPVVPPPVVPPPVAPPPLVPPPVVPPPVGPPPVGPPPVVTPPVITPPVVTPPVVTPPAQIVRTPCQGRRGRALTLCRRSVKLRAALARCARQPRSTRALCIAAARRADALVRCGDLRGTRRAACILRARRTFALARCATLPPSRRQTCNVSARRIGAPALRRR